jgi:hypothetical protein
MNGFSVSRIRRAGVAGGLFVLVAGAVAVPATSARSADLAEPTTNNFDLRAGSDGLGIFVRSGSLPVIGNEGFLQAAAYGSSAKLSSLGDSSADAGAPYAPFVASLPSTAGGLLGGQLPSLPQLPGYVQSAFPNVPEDLEAGPGYEAKATSSLTSSRGVSVVGGNTPESKAAALTSSSETTVNASGVTVASADSTADGLNFGGVFRLGNVATSTSLSVAPSQKPVFKSITDLGVITFLDLPTGISSAGVGIAGAGEPISVAENAAALNAALAPLGYSLRIIEAEYLYTDGSVGSGARPDPAKVLQSAITTGLEIAFKQDIPTLGPATVSVVLGRASVAATNTKGLALGSTSSGSTMKDRTTDGSSAGVGLARSTDSPTGAAGIADSIAATTRGPLALTAAGEIPGRALAPAGQSDGSAGIPVVSALTSQQRSPEASWQGFYLLILAVAGLMGSLLVRAGARLAFRRG